MITIKANPCEDCGHKPNMVREIEEVRNIWDKLIPELLRPRYKATQFKTTGYHLYCPNQCKGASKSAKTEDKAIRNWNKRNKKKEAIKL